MDFFSPRGGSGKGAGSTGSEKCDAENQDDRKKRAHATECPKGKSTYVLENIQAYDFEKFATGPYGRLISFSLSGAGVHARWGGNLAEVSAKARESDIDDLDRELEQLFGGDGLDSGASSKSILSSLYDLAYGSFVWSVSPGVQRYVLGAITLVSFAI